MSEDDEIRIRPKRDPDAPTSALDRLVHLKWRQFVYRLVTRQSSPPHDFTLQYKRKAELDQKFSDDPRP